MSKTTKFISAISALTITAGMLAVLAAGTTAIDTRATISSSPTISEVSPTIRVGKDVFACALENGRVACR